LTSWFFVTVPNWPPSHPTLIFPSPSFFSRDAMSRAIAFYLLSAGLTFFLILPLVYAIPTPAVAPNSGIRSPQGVPTSATNNSHFNGCSPVKQPPSGSTTSDASPFWMEKIKRQGKAPFNPDPDAYKVFRNVKVRGFCVTD